jgi:hypothetical protein
VVLRDPSSPVAPEDLAGFLSTRLAKFKIPKSLSFTKVLKKELRGR